MNVLWPSSRSCTPPAQGIDSNPIRRAKLRFGSRKRIATWLKKTNSDFAQRGKLQPSSMNQKHKALNHLEEKIPYSTSRRAMKTRFQLANVTRSSRYQAIIPRSSYKGHDSGTKLLKEKVSSSFHGHRSEARCRMSFGVDSCSKEAYKLTPTLIWSGKGCYKDMLTTTRHLDDFHE